MSRFRQNGIIIVSIAALVLIAGATVAGFGISRARRMSRIMVAIVTPSSPDQELIEILDTALRLGDLGVSSTRKTAIEPVLVDSDESPARWDTVIAPVNTALDTAFYIAIDPFVLIANNLAGNSPAEIPGATIGELASWLGGLDTDAWTPLTISGDEKLDFAAFIMYLAGEMLDVPSFDALWSYVSDPVYREDADAVDQFLPSLSPVVERIQAWRSAGILADNWTDWDHLAVRQRILDGRAAVTFSLRSAYKGFEWQDQRNLSLLRLPTGEKRRQYRMIGRAIAMIRGEGPRADGFEPMLEVLRGSILQLPIEEHSLWSPVAIDGAPINREHRDIVQWFRGASGYLAIDQRIADHVLFERLHILLR